MRLIALAVLLGAGLQAQDVRQMPLWLGKTYAWLDLDPSFVVKLNPDGRSGTIGVLPAPPVQTHQHVTGAVLMATNGVYNVPPNAVNVEVFRNNLRMTQDGDYILANGVITPNSQWGAFSLVVVNYVIP